MKTEMIKIDRDDMDLREMKRAGEILKKGGLVAFPTETVYGLGGDALDETAALHGSWLKHSGRAPLL